ncbi:hypothetical protein B0T16DRAFT_317501 [Cercophora newfieldiana]|uniref:HNH nuclease domain-containing protein n=1 Tax=Cercophora newfieldiana TaxID=92897 RepID=A0AA40CXS0_9PEZI|nr:hypothetical protein B0T16DRAFT_317501 [Cercophora newfieldiana]
MAGSSHRHQSSLEGVIDLYEAVPIFENVQQRTQAIRRFRRIITYFEDTKQQSTSSQLGDGYNRPALIRLTFEFARSPESQDMVLKAFFQSLALGMLDDNAGTDLSDDSEVASLRTLVFSFADHLIYHFFLPLRAATVKTPQPTPTYHVAVEQVQTQEEQQRMQDFTGTPERLGALRGLCLTRDRHRCVITRAFDHDELVKRLRQPLAKDDDGNVLNPERDDYSHLEVAHILPFSLTKVEGGGELSESKKAAIAILNMFDIGVIHLIEGVDIDRPRNAITLSHEMHMFFGNFEIFFERVADDDTANTYQIQAFRPFLATRLQFPVRRTLFSHPSIDPPLERLLRLHSAIGHILYLSGAGEYINVILRDMEDGVVREDGSTQLGALVNVALRNSGWTE